MKVILPLLLIVACAAAITAPTDLKFEDDEVMFVGSFQKVQRVWVDNCYSVGANELIKSYAVDGALHDIVEDPFSEELYFIAEQTSQFGGPSVNLGESINFMTTTADHKSNVGVLNVNSGMLRAFEFSAGSGLINALAFTENFIFVGGNFASLQSNMRGQPQEDASINFAGIHRSNMTIAPITEQLDESANEGLNGAVSMMTQHGNTIVVMGSFTDTLNHDALTSYANIHPQCAAMWESVNACLTCRTDKESLYYETCNIDAVPAVCMSSESEGSPAEPADCDLANVDYSSCTDECEYTAPSDATPAFTASFSTYNEWATTSPRPNIPIFLPDSTEYVESNCPDLATLNRMNGIALFDSDTWTYSSVPGRGLRGKRSSASANYALETEAACADDAHLMKPDRVCVSSFDPTTTDTTVTSTAGTTVTWLLNNGASTADLTASLFKESTLSDDAIVPPSGVVTAFAWNSDNTVLYIGGSFLGVMDPTADNGELFLTGTDVEQYPEMMGAGKLVFSATESPKWESFAHEGNDHAGLMESTKTQGESEWKSCDELRSRPFVGATSSFWSVTVNGIAVDGDGNVWFGGEFGAVYVPMDFAAAGQFDELSAITANCGANVETSLQVSNGKPSYDAAATLMSLPNKCEITTEASNVECECQGRDAITFAKQAAYKREVGFKASGIVKHDGSKFVYVGGSDQVVGGLALNAAGVVTVSISGIGTVYNADDVSGLQLNQASVLTWENGVFSRYLGGSGKLMNRKDRLFVVDGGMHGAGYSFGSAMFLNAKETTLSGMNAVGNTFTAVNSGVVNTYTGAYRHVIPNKLSDGGYIVSGSFAAATPSIEDETVEYDATKVEEFASMMGGVAFVLNGEMTPVGNGLYGDSGADVYGTVFMKYEKKQRLIAYGGFSGTFDSLSTHDGGRIVNGIAMYDEDSKLWTQLGEGLGDGSIVYSVEVDESAKRVYVIGDILHAGEYTVNNAAYFDFEENTWKRMGNGFDSTSDVSTHRDGDYIYLWGPNLEILGSIATSSLVRYDIKNDMFEIPRFYSNYNIFVNKLDTIDAGMNLGLADEDYEGKLIALGDITGDGNGKLYAILHNSRLDENTGTEIGYNTNYLLEMEPDNEEYKVLNAYSAYELSAREDYTQLVYDSKNGGILMAGVPVSSAGASSADYTNSLVAFYSFDDEMTTSVIFGGEDDAVAYMSISSAMCLVPIWALLVALVALVL